MKLSTNHTGQNVPIDHDRRSRHDAPQDCGLMLGWYDAMKSTKMKPLWVE